MFNLPKVDRTLALAIATPLIFAAPPAYAYVGPGMGAGVVAVILGLLASIVIAFAALLWYPVKRLIKRRKPGKAAEPKTEGTG